VGINPECDPKEHAMPTTVNPKTATPTDPHTTESVCTSCGGSIYRTLLEGSGPTRTYWRHDTTGYASCPAAAPSTARALAHARPEADPCQRGTVGCAIDHQADTGTCETW